MKVPDITAIAISQGSEKVSGWERQGAWHLG